MSLWYAQSGPNHFTTQHAGQTLAWCGYDSQKLFEENLKHPEKKKMLENSGWLDTPIEYKFNHQGFRCEEFDDRACAIAVGCSLTAGIALNYSDTWVHKLSCNLGLHIWNLGIPSGSMGTCFRMLDHYIHILHPKFVVILTPAPTRFEYQMFSGEHCILMPAQLVAQEKFAKEWFFNDENSNLDYKKNLYAMQHIALQNNIPAFVWTDDALKTQDSSATIGRDLAHCGATRHTLMAEKMHKTITPIMR